MNLRAIRRNRHRPAPGDIFVMAPPGGRFLFGRVIRIDANAGGFPNSNLVYIYRVWSESQTDIPVLRPADLLIPPLMTNNRPWFQGYFVHVTNRPLEREDLLPQHSFRGFGGRVFDETGAPAIASDPIGDFGLHSYRTIDDAISFALGIPLAPEDSGDK